MDVLYRRGRATAAEVREQISDPPSYSAVRAMLRVLEEKGHIRHEEEQAFLIIGDEQPRGTLGGGGHGKGEFRTASETGAVAARLRRCRAWRWP